MPDKHGDKKKHDPKEQRKPRGSRNQATGKSEKKIDKNEDVKPSPKVTVPQKPPVFEDPGPDFYKNLKRETDEIIKITEEENSKYKKKEIQSNWAKYEMPIESYEETEEHDVGADYDKLIQMPLTSGGHFQFKHEKSWDAITGPSPYDKYFNIDMENLSTAVSTIPFYERSNLDKTLFTDTDILTMDNRATKYKNKYYNDNKYTTVETEAQERIFNLLKDDERKDSGNLENDTDPCFTVIDSNITNNNEQEQLNKCDVILQYNEKTAQNIDELKPFEIEPTIKESKEIDKNFVNEKIETKNKQEIKKIETFILTNDIEIENEKCNKSQESINFISSENKMECTKVKTEDGSATPKSNPVIESPEDLEKWLDDFLDD